MNCRFCLKHRSARRCATGEPLDNEAQREVRLYRLASLLLANTMTSLERQEYELLKAEQARDERRGLLWLAMKMRNRATTYSRFI